MAKKRGALLWLILLFLLRLGPLVYAGGSGLNVVVVVNQASTNSVELGNYYCERRQVPAQNLLRINWPGANTTWTYSDFTNYLVNPLLGMLSSRQLTNQIDYVVLSMDIPFQVTQSGAASGVNSTTSALFYGFKPDLPAPFDYTSIGFPGCNLPYASSNSYAGTESILRSSPPNTATTNSFMAVMITSTSLPEAKAIVDQGVASDNTFPTQIVILGHSSDFARNIRYVTFDNAIFNTRLRSNYSMVQSNSDTPLGLSNLLGYQNGLYQFTISSNTFIPGAMADSLTSYGGVIFGPNDQTTLLTFINSGASGSYGTVVEPCAYLEKFPSPQDYFYQARGFSLAESYYMSLTNPHQGLIVGEPLAAPFAQLPGISWTSLPANAVLSGSTNLSLLATGSDIRHPVQQVDIFLDGDFLQTITNIPPRTNNILYVTINGFSTNYIVPAAASISSVVSNLVLRLNQTAFSSSTKVVASAHGDRIELRSMDITRSASQMPVSVSNSVGTATALTTFLSASGSTLLGTAARGVRSFTVTNSTGVAPAVGSFLQLTAIKTNGQTVIVSVTNTVSGTTFSQLGHSFFNAVNSDLGLSGSDGLDVEDVVMHEDYESGPFPSFPTNDYSGDFDVHARTAGWPESQIKVRFSGSAGFSFTPSPNTFSATNTLDANVTDLQPRAHLYVAAGLTNLPLTFSFNTSTQSDGYHELTAVAYEGSHVHTQNRVVQSVRIQNNTLSAVFTTLVGGSNTVLGVTLQFSVVANTNTVSKIELFSTGGSLTNVPGQSTAIFSVAGTNLGPGLHPFYSVVTVTSGKQYQTETKWIRLVTSAAAIPFALTISNPPPTLLWSAVAGQSYDILSATNLTNTFQLRDTVVPSNSAVRWVETNGSAAKRFYRVRTSN
jgi:uncharacterized protein (TIGR03790 family)